MKPGTSVAVLALAIAVVAGGYWSWVLVTGDDAAEPMATFAAAERRSIASTVLATGVVRLRIGAEVRVGSQLSGIVEELNVIVGSKIERGDVIARIDSRGLEARLAQARAQVSVLEQEVRRTEVELARAQQLDVEQLVARTDVEDRTLDCGDRPGLCCYPCSDLGHSGIGVDPEGRDRGRVIQHADLRYDH